MNYELFLVSISMMKNTIQMMRTDPPTMVMTLPPGNLHNIKIMPNPKTISA